jgi:hypothetical protein
MEKGQRNVIIPLWTLHAAALKPKVQRKMPDKKPAMFHPKPLSTLKGTERNRTYPSNNQ